MRTQPIAQGQTAVVLDAMADLIEEMLDSYDEFQRTTGWQHTDHCPMTWDVELLQREVGPSGPWTGDHARAALGLSVLYVNVCTQYLETIRSLLRDRQVLFGIQGPSRTLLEFAGQICWLLDPRVSYDEPGHSIRDRSARWCLGRINDLTRARTTYISLRAPRAEKVGWEVRQFRLYVGGWFRKDEWDPTSDPKDKTTPNPEEIRGQRMPGGSDRVAFLEETAVSSWKARGVYDWLSNFVHPSLIAITDVQNKDTLQFWLEDADMPRRVVQTVLGGFIEAWRMTAEYAGLDGGVALAFVPRVSAIPLP